MRLTKYVCILTLSALGLCISAQGGVVFTEDFEGFSLLDGEFQGGWDGPGVWNGVNPYGAAAVLNPADAGSPWLSPVPAELGEAFGTMGANSDYSTDLTAIYWPDAIFTLSFTQFRRNDIAADVDGITAQLMTTSGALVSSVVFAPVTTTGTFEDRTLVFDTAIDDSFNGENIRIRFVDPTGSFDQTGIDNIQLDVVPEPATMGLLGVGALFALAVRRLKA